MLTIIIIQSIIFIALVGVIYRQFQNKSINPELSNVYREKERELQNIQIMLAKAQGENQLLNKNIEERDLRINDLNAVIKNRDEQLINLSRSVEKVVLLEKQNAEKDERNNRLEKLIEEQNSQIIKLKSDNSFLSGENNKLLQENNDYKELAAELDKIKLENKQNAVELEEKKKNIASLMELQEQIKNQFKVISSEIIKEQKETFNREQNESLGNLLIPLNKDLKEFKEKIQQVQDGNNANTIKIEENIKNLLTTTKDIGNKADNLATALKGDKKAQGNWGEFQLQNLLEMSGLEENISFFKQYNIKNNNGENFYLDFLIKLPEDRILIVDSKVSMVNYEKYICCNNQDERLVLLKSYCEDIKHHIKELGSKEYQNIYKEHNKSAKDTPDFVFMFVAVEGAYIDAIKFDKSIFDTALNNKVAIVTTSSFMPVLRMIEHLWSIENQNKYISDIVDLSKKLYAKMEKFSKDIKIIGDSLDRAKDAYTSAKNYISTGKGNMLSISDKIINIAKKGQHSGELALEFDEEEEN